MTPHALHIQPEIAEGVIEGSVRENGRNFQLQQQQPQQEGMQDLQGQPHAQYTLRAPTMSPSSQSHSTAGPSGQQQHQQQQQQYLPVGTISPGVMFSDDQYEQYDSDMEPELELGPSRETLHEGQILKSGFLHKKGERLKIWKKKWFVLRTSKLAYYKDIKEYELLRIIDIRDIHKAAEVEVKNKAGVFMILTPRRTFTVQADSVAEMEEWVKAINQAKVQHDLISSSDIDSYAGSTTQLDNLSTSAPVFSRKPELVKQGSGTLLPRRPQNPLSLSDPGMLATGENLAGPPGKNISLPPASPLSRIPELNTSGASQGILSQSLGQMPATHSPAIHHGQVGINNSNNNNNNNRILPTRTTDGLSLVTSGIHNFHLGVPSPLSPPRDDGVSTELTPNSFTSNHSFNAIPTTPSSPGYGSGCEHYYHGEANASSEEEDVVDDPTVLEAGRIAAAANAPGSGLVTGEQLGSKVVRQGYLLKLGNTYKTWRKKWFVLRGDKLTYYKNQKEYQPHGIIPLSTIIDCLQTDPVSKHKQYCLRIVTAKRSFVCCAPDEDTLLQWLDALHVECDRVAQEAKQAEDGEATKGYGDDNISDSRTMDRTAQQTNNGLASGKGPSPLSNGGAGTVLEAPLRIVSNLDGIGSTQMNIPVSPLAPSPSVGFHPKSALATSTSRLHHQDGSVPTRTGGPTVTFST
ncbi:hypothetical protein BGZ51_005282 [Haplosporangium sp. Z 767]|nr:hypothetical protein BGZ51_005282 [Haplosporangium sp. Z 767]